MRLHSLTATAFGPFPTSVEVDFDDVCSAGLFLIHGATGAGKTSLLDAICYALFADVPGARTRRGLASDHVEAGTRPSVRLELSVGDRRLRIERSPEFDRPKKRGTGLTRVPAAVTLEERVAGRWRAVSTRHDEVADVLDEVLGMGLAQFAKVVVLPQGDVSAFLRATPEDRRILLERLFDISTFTGVEEWLAEERRASSAEVERLTADIGRDLDRLHDHLDTDTVADWRLLAAEALPAALADRVAEVEHEVLALLTAADEASTALGRAGTALHDARAAASARQRGLEARQARDAALGCADEVAVLRRAVERAVAADAVSGHLAALDAAVADEARARSALDTARRAVGLPALEDRRDSEDGSPTGADPRVVSLSERLHEADSVVGELVHAAREHERAVADLTSARAAVATAETAASRAARELGEAETRRATAACGQVALETRAASHAEAEGAFRAAELAVRIAGEVDDLGRLQDLDRPGLLAAREAVLAAQETVIDVRQRRLDGMAAELASALAEGERCPVCGSAEHPERAVARAPVTAAEVDTAEQALSAARGTLSRLERTDAARAARIEALRDQLGGAAGHDLAGLTAIKDTAAEELSATTAARRDLPAAEKALAEATTRAEEAADRVAETDRIHAVARAGLAAATAAHDTQTAALRELRARHRDCPCGAGAEDLPVAEVDRRHGRTRDSVDGLLTATAGHHAAVDRRRDRLAAAVTAATERGFADLDEARAARLDPSVIDRHRGRIADHGQILAVTSVILAEDEVAAALEAPEPDLTGAAEAESAARRTLREAQSAHSTAEARLSVLRSVQGPVCSLVERLARARARAATVKNLADAATGVGGGNLYRMRLSAFVLAARLEQVVALANERLRHRDAGRYLLEHSDARVSGGARSGLDLRVLDQWTGRSRETASLSGGESFMVSLALALGLAEAVREESGGFDLGTLFIDEGFGSLDEESLEHVLGVLDGLREGGRAVGVVSHVPELRTRISHQVVVEKTATGSSVSVRTVA